MRTTSFLLGATLALAISLPANAIAPQQPGAVMHITPAASTPAPLGLQIFCMRSPAHCAAAPATQLRMDENLMTLLNSVNRSVNAAIRPQMRSTQVWELGARTGDCKDYAMNKRAELIARGIPAGALRLAIGFTARGQGHAVLVVRTTAGDYVLDNLTNTIKPFNQTGLTLTAMASHDPKRWNTIG